MHILKEEFRELESNGYLGDVNGPDAYAYLRASSERQVEEGSSFTRQLESIHKAANRNELRIPLMLIFFDDGYTGYEFEHRPALLNLRYETRTAPRAHHLVIEDIDRLSRNADWQQGFLLEEFFRSGIEVHFYSDPGSALERYIRGYMAQEEMKKAKERMRMGNIYKAMSGKVTAKRPRYGYVITKDSRYELHPEESKVMRWVYERLIYRGWSLYKIAHWLNDNGITTRFKTGFWTASTLLQMVKSPVYRGDFYANRHYWVKTGEYKADGKPKVRMKTRPESEWIHVPVPAIVTPDEWEAAQEVLARNAKRSTRYYKKREWLLAGLLKCELCKEFAFTALLGKRKQNPQRYYKCNSLGSERARKLKTACYSPHVYAEVLEQRVWEEMERLIYDPNILVARLEERNHEEHMMGIEEQLDFINAAIKDLDDERIKIEAAYHRDIYSLDEFEEKMQDIKVRAATLEANRSKIEARLAEHHSIEEQKQIVILALKKIEKIIAQARNVDQQPEEIPFELKRKILSLLVEVIWVNSSDGTFTIEGEIKGIYAIDPISGEETTELTSSGIDDGFGVESSPRWR